MFRFKKVGSFLSVLTVLSVVAGSFPVQALAQAYNGELQLPNTRVLPDYVAVAASGYGYANTIDIDLINRRLNYFGFPASFTLRENNNFVSSLPQKVFSASSGVFENCDGMAFGTTDNTIILAYAAYDPASSDDNPLYIPSLCLPLPAAQDITSTLTNGGNLYSEVVQTYDMIPALALGESTQNTVVESIPNDPNNVRVSVSENVMQESYGLHFERQGEVVRVVNGDHTYANAYNYNVVYKDGNSYFIGLTTNWAGQVLVMLGYDGDGNAITAWGDPSAVVCDDYNRCSLSTADVNTGYPTPQITQLASISPVASNSVVRPRNSDIVSITQPQCTRGSKSGFFKSKVWVDCTTYGLSADGRIGTANYHSEKSGFGWFMDVLGAGLLVAGLYMGASFLTSITTALSAATEVTLSSIGTSVAGAINTIDVALSVTNTAALATINAFTVATVAAISGPSALGTVETSNGLGVGTWTWSQAPGFAPGDAVTCAEGATEPACLDNPSTDPEIGPSTGPGTGPGTSTGVCPNGATNYPVCSIIRTCANGATNYPTCLFTGPSGRTGTPPPPPASPNITSWQVAPTLVRSGEPTFVSWNTVDVSDCTVSGTNNKSWSGKTGTREQSDPIFGQTVFSISCAALAGASPATVSTSSKTVNIIPTFQEQ